MKKLVAVLIAVLIVVNLAGCVTVPSDALVVTPELLQRRQLETRQYTGIKEADILAASANVLQDLGFNIEESETKLGVITANKERGGASAGEIVAKVIVAVFTGVSIPWNKDQKIRVSLVVRPSLQSKAGDDYLVRVTFQRIVKLSNGAISMESLSEPELYTHFFDKLSKAVFIEGKTI